MHFSSDMNISSFIRTLFWLGVGNRVTGVGVISKTEETCVRTRKPTQREIQTLSHFENRVFYYVNGNKISN